MNPPRPVSLLLAGLLGLSPAAVRAQSAAPVPAAVAPADLEAPANQTLALTLAAKGVQIYVCQPTPGPVPKYEWTFKAPEADLFDAEGRKVGRHFAGPTWELTDGGKVVGQVKAKADAPDGKGVPWLLLNALQASGSVLGKVQSIRRIDTAGGQAPKEAADKSNAGHQVRVPYTATYEFYAGKP